MDSLFNKLSCKVRPVVYGVLIVVATIGCSEDTDAILPDEREVPLQVSTEEISGEVETRAVTQSIGIFRASVNGYTLLSNVRYDQINGKSWQAHNSDSTIYLGTSTANLKAYFPYGVAPVNEKNATIELKNQAYNEQKVLYFAATGGGNVSLKNPTATFKMTPVYARLRLNLTRGEYSGRCRISSVTLNSADNGFIHDGLLYAIQGSSQGNARVGGWTYNYNTTLASWATDRGYDVLIVPQSLWGGLKITINIDGKDASLTIPSITLLNEGESVILNILVGKVGIIVTGLLKEDYNSEESFNVVTKPT